MSSNNVNYLCILAYNWRMVDFYYKVFSQKLFRIKFRFEWCIIWPYLTKSEFWSYGPGAHSGACPYMGIGRSEKIAPRHFSNPTYLLSIQPNSSLVSQFQVLSPKQPHYKICRKDCIVMQNYLLTTLHFSQQSLAL